MVIRVNAKSHHVINQHNYVFIIYRPEQIRMVHYFVTRHEFARMTSIDGGHRRVGSVRVGRVFTGKVQDYDHKRG